MSLGYYQQIEGGIYGTPQPGDPVARADLQESEAQEESTSAEQPTAVPPGYDQIAAGNPPIPGWTVQNTLGSPTPFRSYNPTKHSIEWTDNGNPVGSGTWDMNEVPGSMYARNDLNRAPIGESPFDGAMGEPPNPTAPTTDVTGTYVLEY